MKRIFALLFVVIVLAIALSACGEVKPVNSVPCPPLSTMTGDCLVKPGSEPMMANSNVPVGMGTYTYIEVTAPESTILSASVTYGNVQIEGEGTNVLRLYRLEGSPTATVNVTAKGTEYPIEVIFNGYAPLQP